MPIPFLELISRIVDGAPPTATTGVANANRIKLFRQIEKLVESKGLPGQAEYLMLYPLGLVSLYPDGVAQGERLMRDINQKVRDLPLDGTTIELTLISTNEVQVCRFASMPLLVVRNVVPA